jgi:hypothetical protein
MGLPSNCRARRERLMKEAASLVQEGLSYTRAAVKLGVSPSAVRNWSLKLGVRSRFPAPPRRADPPDTGWELREMGGILFLESPTYRRLREVWRSIGELQELIETGAGDPLELQARLQALQEEERHLTESHGPVHRLIRIVGV